MNILILPGFSTKNSEWAKEVEVAFSSEKVTLHQWKHWKTQSNADFSPEGEVKSIVEKLKGREFVIIAKSIGTWIASKLVQKEKKIKKIIFCGIPIYDLEGNEKINYRILKNFPAQNILILQNENDNHGTFAEVESFIHSINPEVSVISKPSADHDYPYFEEFKEFLK